MREDWLSEGEGVDTEFKVSLPSDNMKWLKTIVAFANGAGGTLVVGVDDDRNVVGIPEEVAYAQCDDMVSSIIDNCAPQVPMTVGVQKIGNKRVIVLDVFPGPSRPYYIKRLGEEEGTFIRVGATSRQADESAILEFHLTSLRRPFDSLENREVGLLSENTATICEALKGVGSADIDETDLRNCGVISQSNGKDVPTNAYALLCSSRYLGNIVKCAVFKDTDGSVFLDRAEYDGPISVQIDESYKFVLRNLRLGGRVEGLARVDTYEIPPAVIREVIVNAIQHRTYIDGSRPTYVAVYSNRIEVTSPGGLPSSMTVDLVRQGRTFHRNPTLSRIFGRARISEGWGNGLRDVFRLCESSGLPEPIIENSGIDVRVTIFRPTDWGEFGADGGNPGADGGNPGADGGNPGADGGNPGADGGNPGADGGNPNQKYIEMRQSGEEITKILIEAIQDNPSLSTSKLSAQLGISLRTTQREMSKLRTKGIIERVGGSRNGHWMVNNPHDDLALLGTGVNADYRIRIMAVLELNPGMTVKDLCEMTEIPSRTVERIISELKREGYLERVGGTRGQWVVKRRND